MRSLIRNTAASFALGSGVCWTCLAGNSDSCSWLDIADDCEVWKIGKRMDVGKDGYELHDYCDVSENVGGV